jgi:hypothetical protein
VPSGRSIDDVDPVARRRRSPADIAWGFALPLLLLAGWAAALALVAFYAIGPALGAWLTWGSMSPEQARRANAATVIALILLVATPAGIGALARRRRWRKTARAYWITGAVAVLAILLWYLAGVANAGTGVGCPESAGCPESVAI